MGKRQKRSGIWKLTILAALFIMAWNPARASAAGEITVSFRLIGCTRSKGPIVLVEREGSGPATGYLGAMYNTWIPTKNYTMPAGSTVRDLFVKALAEAGLESVGADGNYVKTIKAPQACGGYPLSEFTNGQYSGWMYTVNGTHPGVGLGAQALKSGDQVVWHYVNDYVCESADGWSGPLSGAEKFRDAWLAAPDTVPHLCTWQTVSETAPTCTKAGECKEKCSICGRERTESLPVLPHSYGDWMVDHVPTCASNGMRTRRCVVCRKTDTEILPALAHTYGEWTTETAPTCVAAGRRTRQCTACGEAQAETIPAAGHKYGGWQTVSAATVTAPEQQTRSCSVCGSTETRENGGRLAPTIQLNAASIPLKTKQSTTALNVSGLAAGDYVVSWKSSDPAVASVNGQGKITAGKKKGSAVITVTLASGLTKTVKVKVQKNAVKTTKISGLSRQLTLAKGAKATLKPIVTPITSKQKVTYSSSKKGVATVNSKGVVTAKKPGRAAITVKSGNKKFKITVTVK